jgi:A/G-specific adenine glycosylase
MSVRGHRVEFNILNFGTVSSQKMTSKLVASTIGLQVSKAGIRRKRLLRAWFRHKSRRFTWRAFTSPWHVLLAEMLLLRTRADSVAKHMDGVIRQFPTPEAMAAADESAVEIALRPFGLRWRARLLHQTARVLANAFDGRVPLDFALLTGLPGVGPYVASATLATLTGSRVLLTDTNTVRVARRVAGLTVKGDVRRRKEVQAAIGSLLGGRARAKDWLGVIDLAATVCLPRDPRCPVCPIKSDCAYGIASADS